PPGARGPATGQVCPPLAGDDDSSSRGEAAPLQARAGIDAMAQGRAVMNGYVMHMAEEDIMGEGTYSICRRGTMLKTNELVAIKVYKTKEKSKPGQEEVLLTRFRRQIGVLQESSWLHWRSPPTKACGVNSWRWQVRRGCSCSSSTTRRRFVWPAGPRRVRRGHVCDHGDGRVAAWRTTSGSGARAAG
ncbi:unnamed protein product, partial [Prorocentrum cordatum]